MILSWDQRRRHSADMQICLFGLGGGGVNCGAWMMLRSAKPAANLHIKRGCEQGGVGGRGLDAGSWPLIQGENQNLTSRSREKKGRDGLLLSFLIWPSPTPVLYLCRVLPLPSPWKEKGTLFKYFDAKVVHSFPKTATPPHYKHLPLALSLPWTVYFGLDDSASPARDYI